MSTRWDGTIIDAEGHRAAVAMTVEQRGAEVEGSVAYRLVGSDAPGEKQEGRVTGTVDERGSALLELELPEIGGVRFNGRVVTLAVHARRSMLGTYDVISPKGQALASGVAIFWEYHEVG